MVEHDGSSPNPATTSAPPITASGLIISNTDAIRSFLEASSTDCHMSEDLRDLSSSLIMYSSIPYKSLKCIWIGSDPETRPDLSAILSGCNFVLSSPKPREKGEELKARLAKLAEVAERKMYEELVKDISPRKRETEPFSSYKDQLGFAKKSVKEFNMGHVLAALNFKLNSSSLDAASEHVGISMSLSRSLPVKIANQRDSVWCSGSNQWINFTGLHVVLIMFTGYLLGYAAFRALFSHSPAMSAAGGILGLVLAMLVETLLFIVRSTFQDLGSPSSTSRMLKKNQ